MLSEHPDRPQEDPESHAVEIDIFDFYNKLQSPWQKLFIDVRDRSTFSENHPIYAINLPLGIEEDALIGALKKDIEAQMNIIRHIFVYSDRSIADTATAAHCRRILGRLQQHFSLSPPLSVCCDIEAVLYTKYPFLCEVGCIGHVDGEEDPKGGDEEKERPPPKVPAARSIANLYAERIANRLEYPEQILNDRLFLGDYSMATRRELMVHLKISHVVNCTERANEFEGDDQLKIEYLQIPLSDSFSAPIALHFDAAADFIGTALAEDAGHRVFVHCRKGVSRSSAVTVAFLMKAHSMAMAEALHFVEARRSCIAPNESFKAQLRYFEENGCRIDDGVRRRVQALCGALHREFRTAAVVERVGRAVAVSVADAALPGDAENKHMAVLYRHGGRWSKEEVGAVRAEATRWMADQIGSERATVSFTIARWGRRSVKVGGNLLRMCLHLRRRFASLSVDTPRVPHISLFRGKRLCAATTCRVCGGSGHSQKRCPLLSAQRISSVMTRIERRRAQKLREIALLDAQQNELGVLQSNLAALDAQTVGHRLQRISASFERRPKRKGRRRNGKKKKRPSVAEMKMK